MASSDLSSAGERIGRATGTIKSVAGQSDFLTIDHGPIDGVGMGAMTMGFDIAGDVDLTGFSEGDTVAFEVKQGRDGSYRIMSICNTGTEGADCLDTRIARPGNPE
ncbi:MAG: copper-binding protein [Hyphomonas sp.]|nr:copper-binding protein [Hyphomonas sp.]MBU3919940.1 copper-binding protein [Alphaproteobacteria bacterium]MBU4063547.1 copper-binding protein [Alphaproteobacteria bacterium]MBU4162778.1 copper-binding protein [Alphaproteobacteria bacterium]